MFYKSKTQSVLCAALLGSALLTSQLAQASATFTSSALLTYTINSITNTNSAHPTDLSGLEISAYFDQSKEPTNFYVNTTGDGAVVANNPSVSLDTIATIFSNTFSVSGSATDGSVDSLHTGLYGLMFNNIGIDSYDVNLSLGYQLNSESNGLYATNSVAVDYYTLTSNLSGFESGVSSSIIYGGALSDSQALSAVFSPIAFTVASLDTELVGANVAITGTIEATAVPLPAATWLFLSGFMGLLGFNKRKAKLGLLS